MSSTKTNIMDYDAYHNDTVKKKRDDSFSTIYDAGERFITFRIVYVRSTKH